MPEKFNPRIWRNYYDQVQILGEYLKDSYPDAEGNISKVNISEEEKHKIRVDISQLLRYSDKYIDSVSMRK